MRQREREGGRVRERELGREGGRETGPGLTPNDCTALLRHQSHSAIGAARVSSTVMSCVLCLMVLAHSRPGPF